MADKQSPSSPVSRPGEPLDLSQSVAGEEDPGASFDTARGTEGGSDQPAGAAGAPPRGTMPPLAPGDEAPAGTPSTGENVCPQCGGTGRQGASSCPNCQGTGKVIVGIGGA